MRPVYYRHKNQQRPGFTLVELILAIAVTSVLAAVVVVNLVGTKAAVEETKLQVDVNKLNNLISLYQADGGSLTGVTNPQSIVDKLKTVRTNADAKLQAGSMTGRYVDVRLATKMQDSSQAASSSPRAVWNPTTQRFDISTAPGTAGVSDFVLDDNLAETLYPTEARTRTAMQYNGNNGWVWNPDGTNRNNAFLTPANATLNIQDNVFDPNTVPPTETTTTGSTTSGSTTSGSTTTGSTTSGSTTSGSTTSGSTTSGSTTSGGTTSGGTTGILAPTTLPKPINQPNGATYSEAAFPTTVTINRNGAPLLGSVLRYRKNSGAWTDYTGPIPVVSGDKIESKNFTTDALLYADSSSDSDTYYKLVASFTGSHTPIWTSVAGGGNLKYTTDNSDPDGISVSHGDTRLDLGGGQYLDAGVENRMDFTRAAFGGAAANTEFSLGELMILNGTTFSDSEATSATLRLTLALTQPVTQNGTVNINYTMVSTPNTSDRLASADTVTVQNPTTSFSVTTGGVTYTLQVRLVSLDADSGVVTGNTFYIYEGSSARAALMGKFVSNK
ncbi:choice-of-anchor K domain-containing protein [Verrucomicrobium sp. BvORR106]|uniref:choice-of-anchor K domain-containing protein n=1 Tax=Verrucomicrobium sp. BvORR106 TaxID=1403819 RepID=UPI0005707346|nr:choice-of-anchor K domain-containing protein [Verrucomicrobium sp. BvORR106]